MNRRAAALFTVSFLLLPGCYSDVEAFAVAKAKQECKRIKECDRSAFVDNHNDDMGQCRADQEDIILDAADLADAFGWEYDPEVGRECVAVSRDLRKDCSDNAARDINEVCFEVVEGGF